MRTIRVEEESSDSTLLWVVAGAALGVVTGIVVAERMSGRKLTVRGLIARGRRLAISAFEKGEGLMDAAMQMREAWGAESEEAEEEDEELDDELGEGDEDELEGELDADPDEELDEEGEAEDDTNVADEAEVGGLDERVLEAFVNDPVLAERAIEIEVDDGTIHLHGRVRSAREVQHAVTIARGVPGVSEVRQRLRVKSHR